MTAYNFTEDEATRLWERVDKRGDDECWPWVGYVNPKGYGQLTMRRGGVGRTIRGHRGIYELAVGPIPEDLTLDHLCRNRACVNPAHLEPVTLTENLWRGYCSRREAA